MTVKGVITGVGGTLKFVSIGVNVLEGVFFWKIMTFTAAARRL